MSLLDIPKLTDGGLDNTPKYGKVQKMTTEYEELNTKMTNNFEKLNIITINVENFISSTSIEELNKVSDEEIAKAVSKIKKSLPEFDCDPELKTLIEKNLSNKELQNKKRKNAKIFIIKHMTKTLPDGKILR